MEFDFSLNYFQLFEIDVFFDLDADLLASNYQKLQSEFHPDRFVDGDEQQKRLAMQATTFINEAHKTLSDDQSRARYMLELQDVPFDVEKDTTQDMDFLMAQMSLREQIDEVDSHEDPLEELDELYSQAKKDKSMLIEAFKNHYFEEHWDEAKEVMLKLQFFARLQEQITHKQESLEEQLI